MFINPLQGKTDLDPCQRSKFHTHVGTGRNTCGHHTFEELLPWYQYLGYGCLCLSNHNCVTDLEPLRKEYDMVFIPGYEYTYNMHMVSRGSDRVVLKGEMSEEEGYQKAIDSCLADGGVPVVCHPNWPEEWHVTKDFLNSIHGYYGMEIVNASVDRGPIRSRNERPNGRSNASNVYDWTLSKENRIIWCFGHDDFHRWCHFGIAWNMIFADKEQGAILDAIKMGCFYVSTGLVLEYLDLKDDRLSIKVRNSDGLYEDYYYRFIGRHGETLKTVYDLEASYVIRGNEGYVRVEVVNSAGKQLYTQPVYDDQVYTLPG